MEALISVISSIIVLLGNCFSGEMGSNRWRNVTSLFGWSVVITMNLLFPLLILSLFFPSLSWTTYDVLFPIFCFCSIQVIGRDCEYLLKPVVGRWMDSQKPQILLRMVLTSIRRISSRLGIHGPN